MRKYINKPKYHFYIVLLITFFVQSSYAQAPSIAHGPFIQHLTTNSVVVNWNSSVNCVSWVEYCEKSPSDSCKTDIKKVYDTNEGLIKTGRLHKVAIKNLKPSTEYSYRIFFQEITDSGDLGAIHKAKINGKNLLYFSTLSTNKETTSCVILSDMHENTSKISKLLKNTKWDKTDFVFLNGDFINRFNKEEDLYKVIDTCVNIFAKYTPLYVSRGNHEIEGSKASELNQYLHFPSDKYYYTFSSGNTFFIVLDSGYNKPDSYKDYKGLSNFDLYRSEEAKWLSEVVKSDEFKNAKHKIVFMHIPPFIEDAGENWHSAREISKKFTPILNNAGIDLMISGHLHNYLLMEKKVGENNFPIVISDNNSLTSLFIDSRGISVKMVNTRSEIVSNLFFEKK